ncbi:MAG: protein translocase subunit SecF [Blastocatellia bacterium]|nr:protein translocase subunit SecF [Blastocatellia bacterium]
MIEIFKDTNYDFIGKKKIFITFSLILSIAGVIAFFVKGFNLGIDFSGGTLVNVRFKSTPDDSRIRSALSKRGIDSSKSVIQPISGQIGEPAKNEVLIRMPQTFSNENVAGGIDADKRAIMDALNQFYSDIPADVRQNKVDINNSGYEVVKDRLSSRDPLGYRQSMGDSGANSEYEKIARYIIDYRDKQRSGIIGDVSEVPLGGQPPKLGDALKENFYAGDFNIVNAEVVGPQVGKELRNRAIYVTLAALAGMLVYIAFRFEWIYGIGAVIATFHDVIVTLAFFSLFGWEISLNVIAALLTLIGYSMNDTIVIFDRIREMLKIHRKEDIDKISNDAINQTLSRTVITSGLTFLSVLALVVFGGPVLRGFSLTLFIGILVGTYSSIAIATPVMLWWKHYSGAQAQAMAGGGASKGSSPKSSGGSKKSSKNRSEQDRAKA